MPSPFPGMDPFIESQTWETFHHLFIADVLGALTPKVRPRYVVRVVERVYIEHTPEESPNLIGPDVTVLQHRGQPASAERAGTAATAVAEEPVLLTVPMPERRREPYLTVRWRETMEVVTVIEVLSPSNKRPGSDGRREYLAKRETVLLSGTHLVELDLLRGGSRLPTREPLPAADHYAFVCRSHHRPTVEVYGWPLRQPLPTIPVPLASGDPDVPLNLQEVFTATYERAGYDYSLDRDQPINPPLNEADSTWVREVLARSGEQAAD